MKYQLKEKLEKECLVCGNNFLTSQKNQICCSAICYKKRLNRIHYGSCKRKILPASTIGSISELQVCSDLLKNGFYVFRSISPNSPFDIIAVKENKLFKIEIRTAYKLASGSITFNKIANDKNNPPDIFAASMPFINQIYYEPEIL